MRAPQSPDIQNLNFAIRFSCPSYSGKNRIENVEIIRFGIRQKSDYYSNEKNIHMKVKNGNESDCMKKIETKPVFLSTLYKKKKKKKLLKMIFLRKEEMED